MGISLDRALRLQERGVAEMRDAYSFARIFKSPCETLHRMLAQIQDDMAKAKAPAWAISYVRGYSRSLMDVLYRDSLVYGGFVDGTFMSTHSNRADYYEKNGIPPSEFAQDGRVKNAGHYWAADTSRPFFIGGNR